MKEKKKRCSVDSCRGYVFAKGLCRLHYTRSFSAPIAKYSKKRKNQVAQYVITRKEFIEKQRDNKDRIFCIFCGGQIYGEPDLHHGLGRDDDLLLDIRYWFLAHNKCHVHEYHSKSCNDIIWWNDYMLRMAVRCVEVYNQDITRQEKSRVGC